LPAQAKADACMNSFRNRPTLNAQATILNSEFDIGRSALGVERLLQAVIQTQELRSFRRSLLRWYGRNGRDLPWRHTRDPYAILVSEVMLQQTQVATVIPYYNKWLRRFPDLAALAGATENDVLHAWQGLGYYRRAQNLHAAAKTVQDRHRGRFPREPSLIRELPGIGRYTANAIATFAFDQSVASVEVNIARLLARVLDYKQPIDSSRGRDAIWQFASTLVPKRDARIFNSALMDLGALVCRTQPKCQICPVRRFCRATKPATLPRKRSRPALKKLTESHVWARSRGRILLQQSTGRWRGMWILPPTRSTSGLPVHMSIFPFTNHRIRLQVFAQSPRKIDEVTQRWIDIDSIPSIPIPSPHNRAIADLLAGRHLSVGR
jgi:A/G-specific adenine glycosylase